MKIKKIIILLILIVILFPYTVSLGISTEQASTYLANYAYNFCLKYGYQSSENQTAYSWNDAHRGAAYNNFGRTTALVGSDGHKSSYPNEQITDKIAFDCYGFVNAMLHNGLGIGPDSYTCLLNSPPYVTTVSANLMRPGDIVTNGTHAFIYIGEIGTNNGYGQVAESICALSASNPHSIGATMSRNLNQEGTTVGTVYRISEETAKGLTAEDCEQRIKSMGDLITSSGSGLGMGKKKMSEWYYNGVPDGEYSVAGSFWDWLVEALKDILIFLIDLIGYILRMVFVGWTAIMENLATWIIESVTGDTALNIEATNAVTNDNITIETIVFNKVKAFDVNFFHID